MEVFFRLFHNSMALDEFLWTPLSEMYHLPWVITGNSTKFFKVMRRREVINPRNLGKMLRFKEVLNDLELLDVGFLGVPFAW